MTAESVANSCVPSMFLKAVRGDGIQIRKQLGVGRMALFITGSERGTCHMAPPMSLGVPRAGAPTLQGSPEGLHPPCRTSGRSPPERKGVVGQELEILDKRKLS